MNGVQEGGLLDRAEPIVDPRPALILL